MGFFWGAGGGSVQQKYQGYTILPNWSKFVRSALTQLDSFHILGLVKIFQPIPNTLTSGALPPTWYIKHNDKRHYRHCRSGGLSISAWTTDATADLWVFGDTMSDWLFLPGLHVSSQNDKSEATTAATLILNLQSAPIAPWRFPSGCRD